MLGDALTISPAALERAEAPSLASSMAGLQRSIAVALHHSVLADRSGDALPKFAQQAVLAQIGGNGEDISASLVAALSSPANQRARDQAARLVSDLSGLLGRPDQLRSVVDSFNALVDASSEQFLRQPPPEFLAVESVLALLVEAAARGR